MKYRRTAENRERAARAEGVLLSYAKWCNEEAISDSTVRDLIQDIMHWEACENKLTGDKARDSVSAACETAWWDFANETGGRS